MAKDPKQMIKQYPAYRLKKYSEILTELFSHYDGLARVQGKSILELGPGIKVDLLNFLSQETKASKVCGIGKTMGFSPQKKTASDVQLHDQYILTYLSAEKKTSFDIIYSRHVMEKYSFHPLLLLKNPIYWQHIKENRMSAPDKHFPASLANLQEIFIRCYKLLKPGGIIISQIAKTKNSALNSDYLGSLKPKPKAIKQRKINKLSSIITVLK